MKYKVIKTELEYETALNEIERLIDIDPDSGTDEANQLELLALLIEDFESKNYPVELPDPIEAIKFRMDQQNLAPRDLIPYMGSRSKVSEALNGQRPLTLSMIRAIHSGLGIPAKVLLQEQNLESDINWSRFPIKEMIARNWITGELAEIQGKTEEVLRDFFAKIISPTPFIHAMLLRKSSHVRSGRTMDGYALAAWAAYIIHYAAETPPDIVYKPGTINMEFMRELVKLSIFDDGPIRAREYLRKYGISLVVAPHFSGTYLDGAALMHIADMPIIGLTLRHDRIDNFWFTLVHELAHLSLHFEKGIEYFYDDLDVDLELAAEVDRYEEEADDFAREALIPKMAWERSPASRVPMAEAANLLAKQLGIHPAIVAVRIRYELKAYKHLNNLIGHNEVRRLFPEGGWK